MDKGAWLAMVHGVEKSRPQLKRLSIHTILSVLVITCCVKNYLKTSWLTATESIISEFLWVKNLGAP